MKRIVISLASALLFVALCCGTIWAQATAQISGTVRDQSGAVLPGVEVTATQTDTGIVRNIVTNETGNFILPNLAIGPYKLEAALPGFRTFLQIGIVLQVNANQVVNPVLEVGQVSEQVEVQANAALVETRSQGVGTVMENQRILELPLNGLPLPIRPRRISKGTSWFRSPEDWARASRMSSMAPSTTSSPAAATCRRRSPTRCRNSRLKPARCLPSTVCTQRARSRW